MILLANDGTKVNPDLVLCSHVRMDYDDPPYAGVRTLFLYTIRNTVTPFLRVQVQDVTDEAWALFGHGER